MTVVILCGGQDTRLREETGARPKPMVEMGTRVKERDVPKVSVCIPTYNTARYLPDAIESVIPQTFSNYELIICDDASTDNTPEICSRHKDPRIRYVRYEQRVGQGGNWNRCVSLARGEYVALLHADDRYLPGFLEQRVRVLDADPTIGLAFGAVEIIDKDGNRVGQQLFGDTAFVRPAPEFYKELLFGCVISPVSPVLRRSCYEAVGKFNDTRLHGIDWEMWLRIAARYGVAYSPAISACYRVHQSSGTAQGMNQANNGPEELSVLEDALRRIETEPSLSKFRPLRRKALRKLALRVLYIAGENCMNANFAAIKRNLRFVAQIDRPLIARPTFWALYLSSLWGPFVYRAFKSVRGVA